MMQRRKRFIKGLSLLVVLVICGLLINNWIFKLNTMRLPELKSKQLSMLCNNIMLVKTVQSQILLL